jgi:hypothetical protein
MLEMFRYVLLNRLGWRGIFAVAAALAVGAGLVLLSLGVAIFLLPIVAAALVFGRWRLGRLQAEAGAATPGGPGRIIEADYSVIEDGRKK